MRKFIYLLFAIALATGMSCASLLVDEAKIVGKVKLSDNPATGNGGVVVSTELVSALTDKNGSFELVGDVMSEFTTELRFQKTHYKETVITVDIPYPSDSDSSILVDIGTVTLERIPQ